MVEIVYKSIWNDMNLTGFVKFVDLMEVQYKQQRFIQVFDDKKGKREVGFLNVDRILAFHEDW